MHFGKSFFSKGSKFSNSRVIALLTLGCVIGGISLSIGIIPYQLDDAYITYRYAANLAQGNGLTFNRGKTPTEGFSSPLWLGILFLGATVFGSGFIPSFAVILGLICFVMGLFVLMVHSQISEFRSNFAGTFSWSLLIPIALLAVMPTVTFYAVTGMEHLLFMIAVIVFARTTNHSLTLNIGLIAGILAIWIRPEGAWLMVMLVFQLSGEDSWKNILKKRSLKLAGSVILGVVLLILMRLIVFGSLLPNTYFAKQPQIKAGFLYVAQYILGSDWVIFIVILALMGAILGNQRHRGYFCAGLSWVLAVILEGGDWMPGARLLLPAFCLFVMATSGIASSRFFKIKRKNAPGILLVFRIMLIILVLAGIFVNMKQSMEYKRIAHLSYSNAAYLERILSDWVKKSGAQSIGTVDIGIIGFLTGIEIVDFSGLTDTVVGRAPGYHLEKKFDLSYVFNVRKPDLIVLRVSKPPKIYTSGRIISSSKSFVENRLMMDRRFREYYQFLFAILHPPHLRPYYGKLVFGHKSFNVTTEAIPPDRVLLISPMK